MMIQFLLIRNKQILKCLRPSSIQRWTKYLMDAWQCADAKCRLRSYQKMKRFVQHARSCKQKKRGGYPICKQLIALYCYHVKHCQEAKCPVPFCVNIKTKLRHQQRQQRLQQAQILKRPLATMQNRGISCPVVQTSPGNSNSSNQPSPGAQPHSSPHPPQPGIGMKPTTGPPQPAPQMGLQNLWEQLMGGPGNMPNSIGNSSMGPPQVMPNPGPSLGGMQRPTQAWQQLLQILKSPPSAQEQVQVRALLKSNPPWVAAMRNNSS